MPRTERVELAVLCLIEKDGQYLLQDRAKDDWKGLVLPGGHLEKDESIVEAVIREVKEETGLNIISPKLKGIKQFPIEDGRYLVFLFYADKFEGNLQSSDEGVMEWIKIKDLDKVDLVDDFHELISVILDDNLTEFKYIVEDDKWEIKIF